MAIQRLGSVDEKFQEIGHYLFIFDDQVNILFVFDSDRNAVPRVERSILHHDSFGHQDCVLSHHPEA